MLKKIVSFVTATVMTMIIATSAAFSQENPIFFRQAVGNWVVLGHKGDDTIRPACVIGRHWTDGSSLQLIFDLSDGEFYVRVENTVWEIGDPPGSYGNRPGTNPAKIVFLGSRGNSNADVYYELHSKNLVLIRHLNSGPFMRDFSSANRFKIIMPGNIQNVDIDLNDSSSAAEVLVSCLETSNKVQLKGPTENPKKKEQGA